MSIAKTVAAVKAFAEAAVDAKKTYLKIEYVGGQPTLTHVTKFSFLEKVQWYLPKWINPFNLQKVADIVRAETSKISPQYLATFNEKIQHHNERVQKAVFPFFYSKIPEIPISTDIRVEKPKVVEKLKTIVKPKNKPSVGIPKGVGIKNAGNTCYQNSLIQALRFSPVFRNSMPIDFLEEIFSDIEASQNTIEANSQEMEMVRSCFESVGFTKTRSGTEEDPGELLSCILGGVQKPTTFKIVDKDLRLVDQSILFLTNDDKPKKTSVQGLVDKQKISFPGDAPDFLPIQPGRYSDSGTKLHTVIRPDPSIKIPCKKTGKAVEYKLVSAILHRGASILRGHYTAVVPKTKNSWLEYNDPTVENVKDPGRISEQCSLLFYEKIEK